MIIEVLNFRVERIAGSFLPNWLLIFQQACQIRHLTKRLNNIYITSFCNYLVFFFQFFFVTSIYLSPISSDHDYLISELILVLLSQGFVVVETNFRMYAYSTSKLHCEILRLFARYMRYLMTYVWHNLHHQSTTLN